MAVILHEHTQTANHFFAGFASFAQVEDQPLVARGQTTEFGRRQACFAKEPFDKGVNVHFSYSESMRTDVELN
jgi:hypothetical protein